MTPDDFQYISDLLKERSGLVLTRDKSYLVENKLMPVIRRRRFQGLMDVFDGIRSGDPPLTNEVVDAMMTLDTSFFEIGHHSNICATLRYPTPSRHEMRKSPSAS